MDLVKTTGVFTLQLWNQEDVDALTASGKEVTAANLKAAGFNPIEVIEQKNMITNNGLNWIRGKLTGDPTYASYLGQISVGTGTTPTYSVTTGMSNEISGSKKNAVVSTSSTPGEIITEVSYGPTEVNNISIYEIGIYTRTDGTTGTAAPVFYARTVLTNPLYKPSSAAQTLTITRRDTFKSL